MRIRGSGLSNRKNNKPIVGGVTANNKSLKEVFGHGLSVLKETIVMLAGLKKMINKKRTKPVSVFKSTKLEMTIDSVKQDKGSINDVILTPPSDKETSVSTPPSAEEEIADHKLGVSQAVVDDIDKNTTDLSQYSAQTTDLSGVIKGGYSSSSFSSAIGRRLQRSSRNINLKGHEGAGNICSKVGVGLGTGVGIASTLQQIYETEGGLTKADHQALNLLESITVSDLLSERKGFTEKRQRIRVKEIEQYIENRLLENTQKKTTQAGLTGTFVFGGGLASFSPFFPPLLAVAGIGICAGLATTALFRFINKYRVRKKVKKLFETIYAAKNNNLVGVKNILLDKVVALNKALPSNYMTSTLDIKQKINYRKGVEESNSALIHTASAFGFVGRFIKVFGSIASGLSVLVAVVSTIFTGVTNYRDRQKKLNGLDSAMMESMIPNILGRKFPYLRKPVFKSFVINNKGKVAELMGMSKTVSDRVLLSKLNSTDFYIHKKKLMNLCIKQLVKEQFFRYSGINYSVFESMSEADFDKRYGHIFKKFIAEKVGGNAYQDTMKAGFNGSLTLSSGVLALSFIPGAAVITLPLAAAIAVVGLGVSFLSAMLEKRKFKRAVNKAISASEIGQGSQSYSDLKQLLMKKNIFPARTLPNAAPAA